MKRISIKGFALVEVLVVIAVLVAIGGVGLLVFSRLNVQKATPQEVAKDAVLSENLAKAKQTLGEKVTADKTIPQALGELAEVSYSRKDNQKAELCATFVTVNTGTDQSAPSFIHKLLGKKASVPNSHEIYRDNVDFTRHAKGRNCYTIDYAPINVAYDKKYASDKKNHKVCDSLRQYHSKYTGQTIRGFVIGGPFTASASDNNTHLVFAQDADAYEATCTKIPLSALKVGDKVELYVEDGPVNGSERTYFVKAVKKEF